MPDDALIDRTISFLNELVAADPEAMSALIETRVPCNATLADHPTVQVQSREGEEPGFAVGLLGVLNGLMGADSDGWGFICAIFDDERRLTKFMRTPPRVKRESKTIGVTCPYCNAAAKLVGGDVIYPHRPDLAEKRFWHCEPCLAYVGCHGDTSEPLGRLANAELRKAKMDAHRAFDPLWRQGEHGKKAKRKAAYKWLAEALGIPGEECHIGMFDVKLCERVVEVCEERVWEPDDEQA